MSDFELYRAVKPNHNRTFLKNADGNYEMRLVPDVEIKTSDDYARVKDRVKVAFILTPDELQCLKMELDEIK